MILFCPRCGAELGTEFKGEWWSTKAPCRSCGVALTEPPPGLAPSEIETEYVLEAWAAGDRAVITGALAEVGFPYRWSEGLVLTVPEDAEDEVNRVLGDLSEGPVILEVEERVAVAGDEDLDDSGDESDSAIDDEIDPVEALEAAAANLDTTGTGTDDDGDEDSDDADEEEDDEADGGDGGEEAHAAMENLFVIADRLQHSPGDATVVYDLVEASEVVAESRPPYGIEREVWARIRSLAATAAESGLDQADDEVVASDARALRDFLRAYV